MNQKGNGCLLSAQVCEGNDILNYDKTKCIPIPGLLIPFPLTIMTLIGLVVFVKDKLKNPESRLVTNLIALLSILETIGLIFVVVLSNSYGIKPTFMLSTVALVFTYGFNLFFSLVYLRQLKQDPSFKYWELEYERSSLFIVSMGLFGNFKFFRMFYSKFKGKREYDAAFTDDSIFYRTVVFTSIFFFITGTLPTMVACIFAFLHIGFGYQVQMFCLEMIVVETFLFLLITLEMCQLRAKIFDRHNHKVKPFNLNYSVMSEAAER